ncbi:MAG TPA: tetratricopeptide repeat protein [Polyangia bacterium]|nr:tetratricopeptide repeat protein [Polyangia bacterium]
MKKLCGLVMVVATSVGTAAWAAPPQARSAPVNSVTAAAEALTRGETLEALTQADAALRADPKNAWAHYNRAAALAGLNRVDESLKAYDEAAGRFAASDKRGKSLALWGKAHLLYRTGRCQEAGQAFAEYTKFVGSSDPQATELASHRASTCHQAGETQTAATATPVNTTAASTEKVDTTPPPKAEAKPATTLPSLSKPEGEGKILPPSAKP